MQADFFTMEVLFMNGCQQDSSSACAPPLAGWPRLSPVYQHTSFVTFLLFKPPMRKYQPIYTSRFSGIWAGSIQQVTITDHVSLQTQGPFGSLVLERELLPHHHVPESVSTDPRLLQPGCVQSSVWFFRPVSEYYEKHCAVIAKPCRLTPVLRYRSGIHSVQPIELNFTDSPTYGSPGNTIEISMDCITMHEADEMLSVSTEKHN